MGALPDAEVESFVGMHLAGGFAEALGLGRRKCRKAFAGLDGWLGHAVAWFTNCSVKESSQWRWPLSFIRGAEPGQSKLKRHTACLARAGGAPVVRRII